MLDIEQITNTIEELENSTTTFDNCLKLASLYIVREKIENANKPSNINKSSVVNEVAQELNDIFPQYSKFCDIKRKFQLNEVEERAVLIQLSRLCTEIQEFIQTLYSSTDFPEERHIIVGMLTNINSKYQ